MQKRSGRRNLYNQSNKEKEHKMLKIREGMKLDFYMSVAQAAVLSLVTGGFGVYGLVQAHEARQDIDHRNPATEIPKLAETFRAACLRETADADIAMGRALNEMKTSGNKPVTITLTADPAAVSDCARSEAQQSYASTQANIDSNADFLGLIGGMAAAAGFVGFPLVGWAEAKRKYLQPAGLHNN
jgi:hypothetical protein